MNSQKFNQCFEFTMFTANCTGNPKNNLYPNETRIRNAEDLFNACKKDHVSALFKDNKRSTENLVRSYAIQADCDNDFSDDPESWIVPANVSKMFPDVCFYYVKSRNCDKVKHPGKTNETGARPRYHYYFPLHNPIEDPETVSEIMLKILEIFPEFDRNGMKPAQFFFGHDNPVSDYVPGNIDIAEYFSVHPEISFSEGKFMSEHPERVRSAAGIDMDFAEKNVSSILNCISADCDHGTWVTVGMAIKSAGLPFEIWDEWSRTAPALYPGNTQTVKKWNSFKGSGVKFGTLVHMAKQNGWKPDPENLTGEYKRNHDAAAAYRESFSDKVDPETGEILRGPDPGAASSKEAERIKLLTAAGYTGKVQRWYSHPDGCIAELKETPGAEPVLVLIRSNESIFNGWKGREELQRENVIIPPAGERIAKNPQSALVAHQAKNTQPAKRKKTAAEIAAESVKDFSGIETKETEYLYFPWFPRGFITSLQGDSGAGKSTFMYAVGAMVSTGAALLGVPCEDPGNVMFVTNEDTESDILLGFIDAGGDQSKLRRMTRDAIADLDFSENGIEILDCAIEQQNLKLVVLDPLQAFLRGDMNKANDTRPQLARLAGIAEKRNCCIVLIQHQGKDTTKSSLHRGIGSVDIGAATRSMLQAVIDPQDDNLRIVFTVKNNTASFYDVSKALRYRIRSRSESLNDKKRRHFHAHAEFEELLPNYSERTYRKAMRKAAEDEERDQQREIEYEKDPLVLTILDLIDQNPDGLYIGFSDLIHRITETCGHCPYDQSKSAVKGLNSRVRYLRDLMIEKSGIQIDASSHEIKFKPYNWKGCIVSQSDLPKERGLYITVIHRDKDPDNGKQETYRQTRLC